MGGTFAGPRGTSDPGRLGSLRYTLDPSGGAWGLAAGSTREPDGRDPDRILLRALRHAIYVPGRGAAPPGHRANSDAHARREELRRKRQRVVRRGDGSRAGRRGANRLRPTAGRLPRDVQLLHGLSPIHLPELLEQRRGRVPLMCAGHEPGRPPAALPAPCRRRRPGTGSPRQGRVRVADFRPPPRSHSRRRRELSPDAGPSRARRPGGARGNLARHDERRAGDPGDGPRADTR